MESSNNRLPSLRRILKELSELNSENSSEYKVHLVEDQLFELHFTMRAPPDTPYANGRYHGKLILPHDYPFRPPEIVFLTPSGRFEVNKKICLSVTNYHPESWQPAWGIRTFLIGISSFMAVESAEAIGSMEWTAEERRHLAEKSNSWVCPDCKQTNLELLPEGNKTGSNSSSSSSNSHINNHNNHDHSTHAAPQEGLQFDYVEAVERKKASASTPPPLPTTSPPPPTVTASMPEQRSAGPETGPARPAVSVPPPTSARTTARPPTLPRDTNATERARMQRARLDFVIIALIMIIIALLLKQ